MNKIKTNSEEIIQACLESKCMSEAAAKTGLHFSTFKRRAVELGVYKANQGGKGIPRGDYKNKFSLDAILNGEHPQFQSFKLKNRLIEEGVKDWKCEECGLEEWNGKWIAIELDHIDGNSNNHTLENLRMLCPNCHSQTETFRFKRRIK